MQHFNINLLLLHDIEDNNKKSSPASSLQGLALGTNPVRYKNNKKHTKISTNIIRYVEIQNFLVNN